MTRYRLRPDASIRNAWSLLGFEEPPLDDPAESFHEASKISSLLANTSPPGASPLELDPLLALSARSAIKRYIGAPLIELPPAQFPSRSFSDVIRARRSVREFGEEPLTLADVSGLLFSAYGVTGHLPDRDSETQQLLRTVPSGGALYPLEMYLAALRVEELDVAIYHYDPHTHALEKLRLSGDPAHDALGILYPVEGAGVSAVAIMTGLFWRSRFKYGLRGYRYVLFEAGHAMQNLLLAATIMDLAAVPLGGFADSQLESLLKIDGVNESVLYGCCIGNRCEGV